MILAWIGLNWLTWRREWLDWDTLVENGLVHMTWSVEQSWSLGLWHWVKLTNGSWWSWEWVLEVRHRLYKHEEGCPHMHDVWTRWECWSQHFSCAHKCRYLLLLGEIAAYRESLVRVDMIWYKIHGIWTSIERVRACQSWEFIRGRILELGRMRP